LATLDSNAPDAASGRVKGENPMSRFALTLAAASFAAVLGLSAAAEAETGAAGRPAGHKAPMHPSTLTLRSGAHAGRHSRHHNYAHQTFHQPTPVHGTMAGPRI
jgi:hypothetical protein